MEIRQSYIKIDSLLREINNFIDRIAKINSDFLKNTTRIESQIVRLKRNLDEHLTHTALQNSIGENTFFEKKQLELLSSLQDNIKELKKDIDECGMFLKKSRDIKKEVESLKVIIEEDILLNIELNNEYARKNHIYEFPPQLIDNLNTAYKNICIAKEGIDAMEIYENIINNINKLC